MHQSTKAKLAPLWLGLVGLVASLITIPAAWLFSRMLPMSLSGFSTGLVFGAAVASFFAWQRREFSAVKSALFLCASFFAYFAAELSTINLAGRFPSPQFHPSLGPEGVVIPLYVVFVGGWVGAFFILTAAYYLFLSWRSQWAVLARSAGWSLLGGIFAACGWGLGSLVLAQFHRASLQFLILNLLWQTSVGAVIGVLVSHENLAQPLPQNLEAQQISFGGRRELQFAPALFFGLVILCLGIQVFRSVHLVRAASKLQVMEGKALAEAPPVENLPEIQPLPLQEALILEDVGGLRDTYPHQMTVPGEPHPGKNWMPTPTKVDYSVAYAPPQMADRSQAFPPPVTVTIEQFPNQAWADYSAKYPPGYSWLSGDPRTTITSVIKFGNKILMDRTLRFPDETGQLKFYWPSGNIFVTVIYDGGNRIVRNPSSIDEEFLRRYLERYRSTLR
jgi:hypothetical protein